ncbi:DUF2244 domain-containing protein [Emcibacter sp. SYSU 3D8]|uniref:DUF2244 domain-containing protein n=1 Tax=Emcibacter sp. SYSU 3D8 TaxID=3133969 RepID=UPI0031FEEB28
MTDSAVDFDAVLHPHRSLSRRAFLIVMIVVGGISFVGGMVFVLMGAWPVFGFLGLDAVLIYIAFRVNFRDGERYERIVLGGGNLEVIQVAPGGAETRTLFQPYWSRVLVDDDGCLILRSHGKSMELGRFLVEHEKESFRAALDGALRNLRRGPATA